LFRPLGHARIRGMTQTVFAGDDCIRLSGRNEVLLIEDKLEEDRTLTLREVQSQVLER
jgi:hypothetical protein